MTIGKWPLAAIAAAGLLGLGLAEPDQDVAARLTRPTKILLDFRDRPVAEVIKELARRSGKRVVESRSMVKSVAGVSRIGVQPDLSWLERTVTLESPAPVPFWEGIDRLAEAGRLAYRVGEFGAMGSSSTGVSVEGDGTAPSPACYAGPFRVGLLGVHEYNEVILVQGAWVRFYPATTVGQATAADLSAAPKDGGPCYVELNVAPEPGLICRRTGPLQILEAVDESGRSLLAPAREDARQSFDAFAGVGGGFTPVLRIPIKPRAPEGGGGGGGRSQSIKTLRGLIPVEIAVLQAEPALVIPLGAAEGKTFRGGGAEFTVGSDRTDPDGRMNLAVTYRLATEYEATVRESRLAALRTYQLQIVDARGEPAWHQSSSSGGDGRGTMNFSLEYIPSPQEPEPGVRPKLPPAAIRYYDLDRAAFQIPFEFHDIPLP
ncbi:hypothetical protein SAMN05444166_5449 [Singulisphaera sp. GP187]|uniref:hypothetical protein n=1 Tax=Singulisphaera sp. GP187 TaxID=1882752 RepID=UPI0009290EA5|nr:hypothetical protein [Singulisphaera sp. GP187]SIO57629.1 hypothetical protein SAMN05444166_5449 [Singulisphaera sp. GP187]